MRTVSSMTRYGARNSARYSPNERQYRRVLEYRSDRKKEEAVFRRNRGYIVQRTRNECSTITIFRANEERRASITRNRRLIITRQFALIKAIENDSHRKRSSCICASIVSRRQDVPLKRELLNAMIIISLFSNRHYFRPLGDVAYYDSHPYINAYLGDNKSLCKLNESNRGDDVRYAYWLE